MLRKVKNFVSRINDNMPWTLRAEIEDLRAMIAELQQESDGHSDSIKDIEESLDSKQEENQIEELIDRAIGNITISDCEDFDTAVENAIEKWYENNGTDYLESGMEEIIGDLDDYKKIAQPLASYILGVVEQVDQETK